MDFAELMAKAVAPTPEPMTSPCLELWAVGDKGGIEIAAPVAPETYLKGDLTWDTAAYQMHTVAYEYNYALATVISAQYNSTTGSFIIK